MARTRALYVTLADRCCLGHQVSEIIIHEEPIRLQQGSSSTEGLFVSFGSEPVMQHSTQLT